jgi:serine phosphatase RsbU (regulator of sigma subunit)
MERVARLAVPQVADWCAVDVVEANGRLRRVALAHTDPGKVALGKELNERYPPDLDQPTGLGAVLRSGEPELYPEIPDELLEQSIEDPEQLAATRALGMRSVMLVPMRVGEVTIGVMTFVSAESGRSFGQADLAFAQDIALRAAAAIENARLYTERDQAAATLQASLLPETLPQLEGWQTSAVYRPGEAGSEVGGDFYDLFGVDGGTMVVLGDVTGKGVQAAALTALARHTARTAARFDPDPVAVLRVVDEVLREQTGFALVTVVCALIRETPAGAVATIARAGHPAPLHVSASGTVTPVGAAGILLGAVPDAERTAADVAVAPGETLLFYTDGVPDTPGPDGHWGEQRLMPLAGTGSNDPEALLRRIDEAVAEYQEGVVVDDRAMLAIRRADTS